MKEKESFAYVAWWVDSLYLRPIPMDETLRRELVGTLLHDAYIEGLNDSVVEQNRRKL